MSGFRSVVRRDAAEPQQQDQTRCEAYGCPCRGSVAVGGSRFTCHAHAFAEAGMWQDITAGLNRHRWLIEFIDEVRDMHARFKDWRAFATRFWTGQDDLCIPDALEDFIPYQNRMRGELLWRVGALPKRPAPRLPKPAVASGHFASYAKEAA